MKYVKRQKLGNEKNIKEKCQLDHVKTDKK